jgi:hypothetical protein
VAQPYSKSDSHQIKEKYKYKGNSKEVLKWNL